VHFHTNGEEKMKTLMIGAVAALLIASPAVVHAGTKTLPDCDAKWVEETLNRVSRQNGSLTIQKVIETKNIRSDDPTESRYCRSAVLTANGRMAEYVYELRWTSETDNRFWLQMKGSRYL
jgi:hypothetical protein